MLMAPLLLLASLLLELCGSGRIDDDPDILCDKCCCVVMILADLRFRCSLLVFVAKRIHHPHPYYLCVVSADEREILTGRTTDKFKGAKTKGSTKEEATLSTLVGIDYF